MKCEIVHQNVGRKIIAHFIDGGRSRTTHIDEVTIVGIRAAGIVDRLLKIWGRNVSDFEQLIWRDWRDVRLLVQGSHI